MPPKDTQGFISKDPGRSIRQSLKRVFGSNLVSAAKLGDSSASSSTRQSSSPAASIASPNPIVDSPSIWVNPTPTPRSALVQPVIEPGAPQGAKRLETTAWMVLEEALHGLSVATKAFPPLKSAASQLIDCLSVIQSAAEDHADYGDLASELSKIIDTLNSYANELSAEDQSGIIAYISQSIEVETARIKKKQDRSNAKRRLCAIQDRNDVMESYLKIQVSFRQLQSNANLWTFRKINKQLELNLLQGMAPEEDARYNSHYSTTVKRRGCTAETREKIHSDLRDWAQNPGDAKVYWMNGMAGTGKTTIAYSLCEWLEANKKLAANFFCSRTKDSCRDVGRIVPTIACQLARYSPAFRVALCKVLEQDQGASKLNVRQQLEKLLKDPLLAIDTAFPDGAVIVVDALDECDNTEGVRLLLTALTKLAKVLPIKFFVSSRPEPAIYEKMQLSSDYSPSVLRLHDIEESIVKEDIQKFLTEAFGLMAIPPSHDQIERLARQSGKLFIYAATVVRFVIPSNAPGVNSSARLQMMLDVDPSGTSTAQPTGTRRYKQLDELYSLILKSTFNEELEEEETVAIRLILSTVVCAKEPLAAQTLARLLALNKIHILSALQSLRSVLHISEDQGLISVLHASFSDYLFDELRSGNYYCDKTKHNYLLATHCFALMEEELHFNICELQSSFIFDDELSLNRS